MSDLRPTRVLVDLTVAPLGGAGTYATGFARGLVDADLADRSSIVVALDRTWSEGRPELVEALRGAGVEVDVIEFAPPGSWQARLTRGSTLRRAVRRHDADVAYFPRDAVPRLDRPYVMLVNNLYAWRSFGSSAAVGGRLAGFLLRRVAHRGARRAATVLAVSRTMAAALPADVAVAAVVHHGCAVPEADPTAGGDGTEAPVVTMIGNVIANKGIEVVIDGVGLARHDGPAWQLRVHGGLADAAYGAAIERRARDRLGAGVLQGPAYGDELIAAYREADVVAVGGTFESFCHPLVEAMRSGCVVVAPACDLVDELCGDVAVTYVADDAPSLAAALGVAWRERDERRRRGIERSRRFSWAATVEATIGHVRAAARPGATRDRAPR